MKADIRFKDTVSGFPGVKPGHTPKWLVLASLIRVAEATAYRVAETTHGFVAALFVPDQEATGTVYIYDHRYPEYFFTAVLDERDEDLTRNEVDLMLPGLIELLNGTEPVQQTTRRHPRGRRRGRGRQHQNQTLAATAASR
jgi:hypothetical protein